MKTKRKIFDRGWEFCFGKSRFKGLLNVDQKLSLSLKNDDSQNQKFTRHLQMRSFYSKTLFKCCVKTRNNSVTAVYFDQHLGAANSKCWLKSPFCMFLQDLVVKIKKNDAKKHIILAYFQMLVDTNQNPRKLVKHIVFFTFSQ